MTQEITILKIVEKSESLRIYYFSKPEKFFSLPGQFAWLIIGEHKSPMAVASSSTEDNLVFAINKWGEFTDKLWKLKIGDIISIDGPHGSFAPKGNHDHIFLIAAGTGITPMRALINYWENKTISLYYGARSENDLLFHDEFKNGKFDYHPICSQPSTEWKGKTGYVTDLLKESQFPINSLFFVCGPRKMMNEVGEYLLSIGIKRDDILFSIQKMDENGNVVGPVVNLNHPYIEI